MTNNTIKLTESELTRIITESVNKVLKNRLNERTKSENGLSDDEVSRKRTLNFAMDADPYHTDSIYDDEQDSYFNKMLRRRKLHHYATQKHKRNELDESMNTISADKIYQDVLEEIEILINLGEIEVIFGEMIGQSFKVGVSEENAIDVTYNGITNRVELPKPINKLKNDIIAKYIMKGFAEIYLKR